MVVNDFYRAGQAQLNKRKYGKVLTRYRASREDQGYYMFNVPIDLTEIIKVLLCNRFEQE